MVVHSDFSNPSTYSGTGATFYNMVNSGAQSIVTNASSYSYSNGCLVLTKGSYLQLASYTFQTVSLWFTPDVNGAYIFDARDFVANSYFLYSPTGVLIFGTAFSAYINGGATPLVSGSTSLVFGVLTNVTFVLNSTNTGALPLFCRNLLSETFVGSISRIVVYNRDLTTTENTQIYNDLK